jgi:hypothetical protein
VRGGALPPALLAAALGLSLAFAPRGGRAIGLVLFAGTATAVSFVPLPGGALEGVFAGCWASVILTAASVHAGSILGKGLALFLAVNAGIWTGAVIGMAGAPGDLVKALPWVLAAFPAARIATTRRAIALKIVSSWLIAVAALAALLPFLPATPGYLPDHLD